MLWGLGRTSDSGGVVDNDSERFAAFKKLTPGKYKYVIGMNEPDFQGPGSSGVISPEDGANAWDKYIGPHVSTVADGSGMIGSARARCGRRRGI